MNISPGKDSLRLLRKEIEECERCPRLRSHCEKVAKEKRRAFADWDYWGKPVAGFGDAEAAIWIVGLAPGAHGANRTGRVFTGDRSGDFLFAALHRAGLANQPVSAHREDGLNLRGVYIGAAVRCAPPANKPAIEEIGNCSEYLDREWSLLKNVRVILALGKIGWDAAVAMAVRNGCDFPDGKRAFAHGAEMRLSPGPALPRRERVLIGSFHVSQQNTFTGKLTEAMFDAVLKRCRDLAGNVMRGEKKNGAISGGL